MSVEPATPHAPRKPDAPAASDSHPGPSRWGAWFDEAPWVAWLGSAAIHASLLIVVSLLVIGAPAERLLWLTSGDDAGPPLEAMNLEELTVDEIPVPGETGAASLGPGAEGDEIELPGPISGTVGNVVTGDANAGELAAPPSTAEPSVDALATVGELAGGDFSAEFSALSNPLSTRGGGLEGRRFENRLEAALAAGGTRESERAVELGLAWLAEHQFPDGGWRFDLEQHPRCAGYCGDSGHYASTTAATGLALLSFLGAGYTHQEGKYADVVSRGLYYLSEHLEITPHGGDLRDTGAPANRELDRGFAGGFNMLRTRSDTMYSHGIATIALTEAYSMTRDSALREPAEQAVQFIINAQYDDGGWRYSPGFESQSRGDMTVTGWQLTALKSGLLAGIPVPYDVWNRANEFLDGLEQDRGARFAYVAGNRATAATTA
ncbi:MAG TPA: prenyltransferase/squalene oxidase repeat-containing protein, partial [Lacipirellulaceae bacterium]|nr:prenyltransferase/squalene oxidase repeat-containing protein [Lacipirellulaceae bacterium]